MSYLSKIILFILFLFIKHSNADVVPMPGIVFSGKPDIIYPKNNLDTPYQVSHDDYKLGPQANQNTSIKPTISISTLTPEQITAINSQPISTASSSNSNQVNTNATSNVASNVASQNPSVATLNPITNNSQPNVSAETLPAQTNISQLNPNINNPKYHKSNIADINEVAPLEVNNSTKNNFTVIGSEGSKDYPALPPVAPVIVEKVPWSLPFINSKKAINKQKIYNANDNKTHNSIVEIMTNKQKAAKKADLPQNFLKISKNIGWQRQILPPNISQKVYVKSNQHLVPITFQSDIDSVAFTYTSDSNESHLLRALLVKITNIDIQDQDGNTLLMYSVYNNNYDAVILLLHNGANPNLYNDVGFGPLHLAASIGDEKTISLLLGYGAEVNVIDNTGTTPIMYACLVAENIIAIKNLLYYGSNTDIINNNGLSTIDFAKSNPNSKILEYINTF